MSDKSSYEKREEDTEKDVKDFLRQEKKGPRKPSEGEDSKDQDNQKDGINIRD